MKLGGRVQIQVDRWEEEWCKGEELWTAGNRESGRKAATQLASGKRGAAAHRRERRK